MPTRIRSTSSTKGMIWFRLALLLAAAVMAGLITDAIRENRVFFPKTRLPVLRTVPAT